MKKLYFCALIVAILAGVVIGNELPRGALTRSARRNFEAKLREIETDAQTKSIRASEEYISTLRAAQREATKNADLDEAVRIRDEITAVENNDWSTKNRTLIRERQTLFAKLAGTTWDNEGHGGVTFNSDGTTARADRIKGHWAAIDDHTIVAVYSDNWADVLTFDDKLSAFRGRHNPLDRSYAGKRIK